MSYFVGERAKIPVKIAEFGILYEKKISTKNENKYQNRAFIAVQRYMY